MRVQITVIYADEKYQDILTVAHDLSRNEASVKIMDVLNRMQNCIKDRQIFHAGDEFNMALIAIGPKALARAHFKCEIIEDPPA